MWVLEMRAKEQPALLLSAEPSLQPTTFFFEMESLTALELAKKARLARQQAAAMGLPLPPGIT